MNKTSLCDQAITREARAHRILKHLSHAAMVIFLASLPIMTLSAAAADISAFMKLISQNEDAQMSVRDLAFFLVTHDIDATPNADHVVVQMGHSIYKLVPNGRHVGLANVTQIS